MMTTEHADREPGGIARRIRRRRSLPGGRAVVGAFLVTAAAVGVFAAHAELTAGPSTEYLVAVDEVPVGTVVIDVGRWFESVPAELVGPARDRVVARAAADQLAGQVVVHRLAAGDPLLWSAVVAADDLPAAHALALAMAPRDALGGALVAGHHVDVLATYGTGRDAWTEFVARAVPVLAVDAEAGAGLGASELVVTVAIDSPELVQRVGHASRAGSVFLSRPTNSESTQTPPPFRPSAPAGAPDGPAPGFAESVRPPEAG